MKKTQILLASIFFIITFFSSALSQPEVAVADPIAKKVAEQIISDGGNAIDAAIGAMMVLTVVEPFSTGLGGGAIFLIFEKDGSQPILVDSRGTVPKNTNPDFYYRDAGDFEYLTQKGDMAVCIPGMIKGAELVLNRYGRLKWNEVLKYAIELARNGFPASKALKKLSVKYYENFIDNSVAFSYFFPDWVPPKVGETVQYPDLATSLMLIADEGAGIFYQGKLSQKIVARFRDSNNQIMQDDLNSVSFSPEPTLSIDFKGYKIFAPPLPSVGGIGLLTILKILENCIPDSMEIGSGEEVEFFLLAYQKAFSELGKFVLAGDRLSISDQKQFLNEINTENFEEIEINSKFFAPFIFNEGQGAATISIKDDEGNWIVVNSTVNDYFGAKDVIDKSGIVLNNFMANFAPLSGLENSIKPGKQPFTYLMPVLVFQDGRPVLALGANGGEKNILPMARLIYYFCQGRKMPVELMKMPRFHLNFVKNSIVLESRFSAPALEYLKKRGYKLEFMRKFDIVFGNYQMICLNKNTGECEAISDVRREGEVYVEF